MTRRDFITPPDIPEGLTCRTLKIPSSKDWLGIFNWAVLTTVDAWRYEQLNETDLTVDEVVAKCHEILAEFWSSSDCSVPTQPGGAPFIGYDDDGRFQQLYDSGWGDPSGDYTVPPIPPRESGTDEDKRCLAAANAANVLKVLYEQLADDYAGSLGEAEALSNFATAIALLIGAWLGLAIVAVIAIYRIMFQVVYETIEFVTADYWTTEFNDKLQCAFYKCASVDAEGVVTFNMECVIKEIASTTDVLSDPFGVLLFGQVQAILNIIGVDGLEAAGATTAITTADCSDCGTCCVVYDFTISDYGFTLLLDEPRGVYDPGFGWRATGFDIYTLLQLQKDWTGYDLTKITMYYEAFYAGGGNVAVQYPDGTTVLPTMPADGNAGVELDVSAVGGSTWFMNGIPGIGGGGSMLLKKIVVEGDCDNMPTDGVLDVCP